MCVLYSDEVLSCHIGDVFNTDNTFKLTVTVADVRVSTVESARALHRLSTFDDT